MSEPGLFCQVNRVKDPHKKEPLEQKHLPVIEAPDGIKSEQFFNLKVKVGEIEHPNENGHFIQWIELYVSDVYLGRFDLAPVMTKPEITIPLSIAHGDRKTALRAVSRCNLHGIWESTKEIEVQ
ncbi:MAG: class II SORL domain-containing protein [Deltaproteobacteria bacterium]|nr:class II SORL domain-containing protein [Deltaproteobacteria bacterium]